MHDWLCTAMKYLYSWETGSCLALGYGLITTYTHINKYTPIPLGIVQWHGCPVGFNMNQDKRTWHRECLHKEFPLLQTSPIQDYYCDLGCRNASRYGIIWKTNLRLSESYLVTYSGFSHYSHATLTIYNIVLVRK